MTNKDVQIIKEEIKKPYLEYFMPCESSATEKLIRKMNTVVDGDIKCTGVYRVIKR